MTASIVILIAIGLIIYIILSLKKESSEDLRKKYNEYIRESEQPKRYRFNRVFVVGIKYRKEKAHDALKNAKEGDPIQLIAERENPYDDRAVKVCYNNIHVGYLNRELAHTIIDHVDNIEKSIISGCLNFLDVPVLYIDISYIGKEGLSDEAISFIMKHQKELGL